jgi:hypothetical protein
VELHKVLLQPTQEQWHPPFDRKLTLMCTTPKKMRRYIFFEASSSFDQK